VVTDGPSLLADFIAHRPQQRGVKRGCQRDALGKHCHVLPTAANREGAFLRFAAQNPREVRLGGGCYGSNTQWLREYLQYPCKHSEQLYVSMV
jgi:hypothetical protein